MKNFDNKKLRDFRIAKGLSQRKLAKLAGVHTSTIHYIEKPNYRFKPRVLHKIAEALEMPESYFYTTEELK